MAERKITDEEALDQIASALGLFKTDPGNNPGVMADIIGYVEDTGRSTNIPEGA